MLRDSVNFLAANISNVVYGLYDDIKTCYEKYNDYIIVLKFDEIKSLIFAFTLILNEDYRQERTESI